MTTASSRSDGVAWVPDAWEDSRQDDAWAAAARHLNDVLMLPLAMKSADVSRPPKDGRRRRGAIDRRLEGIS